MKVPYSALLLTMILTSTALALDLSPGNRFPTVALPSIDGNQPLAITSLRGDKVMLHMFASW